MTTVSDNLLRSEGRYPPDFLQRYEPLECLSARPECDTLYVKDRQTGDFAVAKCYLDKSLLSRDGEGGILDALQHNGLPRFYGEYENDGCLCVVREYCEGQTLSEAAQSFSRRDALAIAIQLCDILTYLHIQTPPVIHRDIKPQNIIIAEDGKVKLIDFGISRTYDDTAQNDTVAFGTQVFAPPEQYGFSQTDSRADLYSLGVVLGWLLTGKTAPGEVFQALNDSRLAKIYRKCTAFAPDARFSSAAKLKRALLLADGKRQRVMRRVFVSAVLCAVFLCGGFLIGRYTTFFTTPQSQADTVAFIEPLIEKAVRFRLAKEDGEPITRDDLLAVTELYIFGADIISLTDEEYDSAVEEYVQNGENRQGSIRLLDDLRRMPNLEKIAVGYQQISDVSPLSSLTELTHIDLRNNSLILDISPLAANYNLQSVTALATGVRDFSPLSVCPRLTKIDAGTMLITTLDIFKGIDSLERLNLHEVRLDTLSGIENFHRLQVFEVTDVIDGDLSPLLELPYLSFAAFGEELREPAELLADKVKFAIEYR